MDRNYAPELPEDVLHLIVCRLSSLVCFVAFRSVCRAWRSLFTQHYSFLVPPPPPWIMLPYEYSSRPSVYGLCGVDEGKWFYQCEIPDNCEKFIGSSGTWLSFVDFKVGKLQVWSPLSLFQFSLPFVRVKKNTALTILKVIVSCTGPLIKNAEDVLVGMVYNDNKLACIKLGDKDWTTIEPTITTKSIHDLVFYKGKFHFIDQSMTVFICEENVHHVPYEREHSIKVLKLIDRISITRYDQKPKPSVRYHLVEVEGELMLVIQFYISHNGLVADEFWVFKLDLSGTKWKLTGRSDLEGYSLFVNYCDGSMAAKLFSGINPIFFKTYDPVEESQSDILNHKVMLSDYMEEYLTNCGDYYEVTKLHRHCVHPVWLIPRYTNEWRTKSSTDELKTKSSTTNELKAKSNTH